MRGKSIQDILRQQALQRQAEIQRQQSQEKAINEQKEQQRQEWLRRNRMYENVSVNTSSAAAGAGGAGGSKKVNPQSNGLKLVWNDIANVPVVDVNSVSDWNDFFTDGYFSNVSVLGNTVTLIPFNTVQFDSNVFSPGKSGNQYLLEIIDEVNCVTSVGPQAIANCDNLTTVILPACTYIGFAAFFDCNNLVTVDFTAVEEIDELGLSGLTSLTTLNLPSLTSAGSGAFYYSTGVISFSAPNLQIAGSYTFQSCTSLTSISLPQLLVVGQGCFQNCTSLTSISLPQCTDLGGTVDGNVVFDNIIGNTISVTVPVALMTCNIGEPDGDIQYLVDNNTVTDLPVVQCNILTLIGVNATTTSNSATNDNTGGWDSSAYSTQTYSTPIILKFSTSSDSNLFMGGFAYTPTVEVDTYLNTSYGVYLTGATTVEIYENGGQVFVGPTITRSVDDVWKVIYDGTEVKYYQNNTLIYTSTNGVTAPLHVFFAFNTANQGVTDICAI
jgi:hypothetical protein